MVFIGIKKTIQKEESEVNKRNPTKNIQSWQNKFPFKKN